MTPLVLKTDESERTRSMLWLLMPNLLTPPGHQQSSTKKGFNYLCHLNFQRDFNSFFPKINFARQGLNRIVAVFQTYGHSIPSYSINNAVVLSRIGSGNGASFLEIPASPEGQSFRKATRRLCAILHILRSHIISKPRDRMLKLSHHGASSQAPLQQHCGHTCQVSQRLGNSNTIFRVIEILWCFPAFRNRYQGLNYW